MGAASAAEPWDGVVLAAEAGARVLIVRASALFAGDAHDALDAAFASLRRLSSRAVLGAHGIDVGFRIEDLLSLAVEVPAALDAAFAERWLRRRVPARVHLEQARSGDARVRLRARIAERPERSAAGSSAASPAARYAVRPDGRIGVEAFELHVVEHCNLRCAHCCNLSPFLPARVRGVDEIHAQCSAMAQVFAVEVFKIMGGEPLLHPDPAGVLRAVRGSGIAPVVRLFTNGLLLHRMREDFFAELDHMTISTYTSAPAPRRNLELARAQARTHGFVLNIKEVSTFSEVLTPRRQDDAQQVQRTFDACWLRHRCQIVRDGTFYTCTRAAYAREFLQRVQCDVPPEDFHERHAHDGVALAGHDLRDRLLAYLNRREPLAACAFCNGGDGPQDTHAQLSVDDVRAGRTRSTRSAALRPARGAPGGDPVDAPAAGSTS